MPDTGRIELTAVLTEMCQAVGADGGGALYLDAGDGTLLLAASTVDQDHSPGLVSRLLAKPGKVDGRTLVLRLDGPSGGVVLVTRRSGAQFTQQDHAVARLFVRRFTDETVAEVGHLGRSGWTRQLEAIQRIASRLTRLASVEDVGATICAEMSEVIAHDEAHVLVTNTAGVLQRVAASSSAPYSAEVPALPVDGLAGDAIAHAASGVPVLVPEAPDAGLGRPGEHSLLIVPLHYESRVSGIICLLARGDHRFDDDDLRLLQILSDQAAVAIENARLLSGRDELVQELSGLLEISAAAGAAEDQPSLAALLAMRVRQATRTDGAMVCRWDEGSTSVRVICRDGMSGSAETIDVADWPSRRQVLRGGKPVVLQVDPSATGDEVERLRQIGAQTLILLPLNVGGRTIGMVELVALRAAANPSPAEMQASEAMVSLAAAGLEKVRVVEQLRAAADMDLVAGVHNHRYLQERLRQEVARSARSHSPLAVMMLDLDKFKPINDRHGHADGDRVLRNVAATIKSHLRTSDVVARYGGDEFVVLMPDTSDVKADQVARRVVSGILQYRHRLSDDSEVTVGVSAGLAVYPTDGRTSAQLLLAADAAMYRVKRSGGRQVQRSEGERPQLDFDQPIVARAPA